MKRKLITLSIVSILTTAYATVPVLAQSLPPELSPNKPPGAPPELPDHPEHIHKTGDNLEIPDELIQHRQNFDQTKSEEKPDEASTPTLPLEEDKVLEDEQVPKQWRNLIKQGDEAVKAEKFSSATSKFARALDIAEKSENALRLKAITLKRLGLGYTGRKQFQEARNYLSEAAAAYGKLGLEDSGLSQAVENLKKWYKELDFHKFGDRVSGYFADAKVERISVFKNAEFPRIEVSLADKLERDLNSEKVKKIKFDKIVSFNFKALPEDKFGLDHVEGLQVKTKKLWVNLFASLMGLNGSNQPEAKVTGGKLGKEKTVTIAVPDDIYDQSMAILKELKNAINSTKYDATLFDAAQLQEAGHEDGRENASSEPEASSLDPSKPKTLPEKVKENMKPPEVIHSLEEPVKPEGISPAAPYNEVLDNHLPEDKPTTRYP